MVFWKVGGMLESLMLCFGLSMSDLRSCRSPNLYTRRRRRLGVSGVSQGLSVWDEIAAAQHLLRCDSADGEDGFSASVRCLWLVSVSDTAGEYVFGRAVAYQADAGHGAG
jgi:hypothetical protein